MLKITLRALKITLRTLKITLRTLKMILRALRMTLRTLRMTLRTLKIIPRGYLLVQTTSYPPSFIISGDLNPSGFESFSTSITIKSPKYPFKTSLLMV